MTSFWDRRENIKQRPSVELRTERVIAFAMEKYSIGIGAAIEKIMKQNLYQEILVELSAQYPDITDTK